MTHSRENRRPEEGIVRIGTVAAIPKILNQLGYDPIPLLAEVGLEPSLFDDPDNVIPYALRSRLIQLCVNKTQCQHFGFLIGQHAGLSSFGLVGFLVQQAPNVATALQSMVRYAHLHVRGGVVYMEEADDTVLLGYSIYQPNVQAREHIEDGALAIAFNIMHGLCGPQWRALEVHFAHRRPADIRPFQQFFKAPLIFDAERNGVLFSSKWLPQSVPGAEPELRRLLQKYVDDLEIHYSDDFVEQVRRVLHSALLTQQATADRIAALFSIHPRTLNRRLKACGTNFHELTDQGRFEIARQWLESSAMELSQIAAALGYADASAFTRAFRRWSGTTPSLWRERCQLADAKPKGLAVENDRV
ncbi:MAG: hypothetical protein AMJ53_15125 [Gammaproteobacteria bacterium SG8_11]|nr:MAG: hypothetical protein AMJ53_15125 [Gammaproteobacteria bacterium SG8_11]